MLLARSRILPLKSAKSNIPYVDLHKHIITRNNYLQRDLYGVLLPMSIYNTNYFNLTRVLSRSIRNMQYKVAILISFFVCLFIHFIFLLLSFSRSSSPFLDSCRSIKRIYVFHHTWGVLLQLWLGGSRLQEKKNPFTPCLPVVKQHLEETRSMISNNASTPCYISGPNTSIP